MPDVLLQHFVKGSKRSQSNKQHLLPSHSPAGKLGRLVWKSQGCLGGPFLPKPRTMRLCSPISMERQKAELGPRKRAGKAEKGTSSASLLI